MVPSLMKPPLVLRYAKRTRGLNNRPLPDLTDPEMALIHLADDDELVREIVHNTLAEQGHVVGMVDNGADAVRIFQARQPDLVILDCVMPRMSGVEALRQIRTLSGEAHTPILMLTARRSSMDEEIALRAGADDYLRKPFSPTQLLVRVELLLLRAARSAIISEAH